MRFRRNGRPRGRSRILTAELMRILLVQTAFLGDVVLSTPVIGVLKRRFPRAELWMMVTPQAEALVRNDPRLEGIITFDKRGADAGWSGLRRLARRLESLAFSRAYALQRSARTSLLLKLAKIPARVGFAEASLSGLYTVTVPRRNMSHDVLRNLCLLEGETLISNDDAEMKIYPSPWDHLRPDTKRQLGDSFAERVVMFPGSSWRTKMWHWSGYVEAARELVSRGMQVVILGSGSEVDLCRKVAEKSSALNLAGAVTLEESMTIMQHSRLVICNDSLALQMASALKVPTVAIYCATSPGFGFGPWRNEAVVVERRDLLCKPCSRHGTARCPLGHEACMRGVSAGEVVSAADKLISVPRS